MPLKTVTLKFPDGDDHGFQLIAFRFYDELSTIFSLELTVQSEDSYIQLTNVVGKRVALAFENSSPLRGITGIIRAARAVSSENSGMSRYLLSVVPPLWLATRRINHRIFQNRTAVQIVEDVVRDYNNRVPAAVNLTNGTYRTREFTAQYGETDHDFIFRLLADEGITTFFDHANGSNWTLVESTTAQTTKYTNPSPVYAGSIPFVPQSIGADPPVPSIQSVVISGNLRTSAIAIRDYDHKNPKYLISAQETSEGAELYVDEEDLEAYHYDVGDVRSEKEASGRAKRLLDAARARRRRFVLTVNTAIGTGTRISVSGHPRDDVNTTLLVTHTRIMAQELGSFQEVECTDANIPFRPHPIRGPRIIGTQTAFVVPTQAGKKLDANELGEVKVEFRWDRRDRKADTSRYVRVSQAWAGQGYGLVCLPRVGDEVVVDFLDGDPDQPIIIGRVFNTVHPRPYSSKGEQTISVWRSRSFPGGNGYNEILLDDKAGSERLDLHAQHDYTRIVENDSTVYVKHNDFLTVDFNKTDKIKKAYSMTAGSVTISTGPYLLMARTIKQLAQEFVFVKANDYIMFECGGSTIQMFPDHIYISSPQIQIEASGVVLVKGSPIDLNP